jgi:precorrin-6A synthase
MIELALVGIGSGDPSQLTPEAAASLAGADVVLLPRKGAEKAELAAVRRRLLAGLPPGPRIVEFDLPLRDDGDPDYLGGVLDWHDAIARRWAALLREGLPSGGRAALMVWGDPSLYDSSLRIADRLRREGLAIAVRLVPGISSLQLLAAAFAIPLNTLGAPFVVTTGRRLREGGLPAGTDTVAVMLDGGCAFQTLAPEGLAIYWGAYLGMEGAILRSGPLGAAGPEIVAARAAARAARGWIMDVYLLRREGP